MSEIVTQFVKDAFEDGWLLSGWCDDGMFLDRGKSVLIVYDTNDYPIEYTHNTGSFELPRTIKLNPLSTTTYAQVKEDLDL